MQDTESGGFYAQVQSDDDGNITKRIIKDAYYFSTAFKKVVGVSPYEYRDNL